MPFMIPSQYGQKCNIIQGPENMLQHGPLWWAIYLYGTCQNCLRSPYIKSIMFIDHVVLRLQISMQSCMYSLSDPQNEYLLLLLFYKA